MTMRQRLLLPLCLVLIACGKGQAAQSGPAENASVDKQDAAAPMIRRTILHEGIEREFFVHIPGTSVSEEPLPVVIALHGYTSTATGFAAHYGLNAHADRNGYIVVYPQGSHFLAGGPGAGSYRVTSWNDLAANQPETPAGPHCTQDSTRYPQPPECSEFRRCAWTACYDDKGFIERVIDVMQTQFTTDTSRFYLLGVSNGAMMALTLGCQLSDRFAAIAPIIGQLAPGYACGPGSPVPMLHLYGEQDDTVRFDGRQGEDGFMYTSAVDTARTWASALACTSGPLPFASEDSKAAGVSCLVYRDCTVRGHQVLSCADANGKHEWPGQVVHGIPASCVSAQQFESMPGQTPCQPGDGSRSDAGMDLVWRFFRQYSDPPPDKQK